MLLDDAREYERVDVLGIEPSWQKRAGYGRAPIHTGLDIQVVCVGGIEPPVSRTRTERSTRLSHTQMSAARRDRTCLYLLVGKVKSLDFECRSLIQYSWITRESNAVQVVYQTTQDDQSVVIQSESREGIEPSQTGLQPAFLAIESARDGGAAGNRTRISALRRQDSPVELQPHDERSGTPRRNRTFSPSVGSSLVAMTLGRMNGE